MLEIKHDSTKPLIVGFLNHRIPTFELLEIPQTTGSSSSSGVVIEDQLFDVHQDSQEVTDYQMQVDSQAEVLFSTTGNGSVAPDGTVTNVTGAATVTADCGIYGKLVKTLYTKTLPNVVTHVFTGWAPGSLAAHITDDAMARLTAQPDASVGKPMFSTYAHSEPTYVRNVSNPVYAEREMFTGVSAWNSLGSHKRAGVAVTPRHVLFAQHYPVYAGHTLRFVDKDNNLVTATVQDTLGHPDYDGQTYYPDLRVALLTEDLPESIVPMKILPADVNTKLPNLNRGVPAFLIDQEEKLTCRTLYKLQESVSSSLARFSVPGDPTLGNYYETVISGDSSSPAFVMVNQEPSLLMVTTFGGAGSGTWVATFESDLNQLISDLDTRNSINTGYAVQATDLSAFPTY